MIETIHIYHTNDVHSHFENWPKIRLLLQQRQQMHNINGESVFLFDIGDHVDRWHPFSEGTLGKGNITLLNEAGYDAVTIGNNEGITLPHEALNTLYENAQFDVILANLFNEQQLRPNWVQPYKVYTTKNGVKIGVVAVTAPFTKLYELLGWTISEPLEELGKQLRELNKHVDVIVVLSHLGIHDDRTIAKLFPEVDVILGGHTHHVLLDGEYVNQSILAAAGKYGRYVGYVELDIDVEAKKAVNKSAILFETSQLPAPSGEMNEIQQYNIEGKRLLSTKVVHLPETLTTDWFTESPLAQLLCEAINEWCGADCAFLNAGLVLDHLQRGTVTKFDIHRILPHPINPCLITLTGEQLHDILRATLDPKWVNMELKGLGFRGKIMGKFVYHDIRFDQQQIYIKNRPLQLDHIYKLGTIDMYTFGHFFPHIHEAEKQYFMPEFLRDVLAWKLQNVYPTSKRCTSL
ncbi:bifunctional UDP-sugar hydrolase/5'-nucleotidase [Heyndrickxia ginsengihumi]|uniref:bifunctional metallophosphatase/5'-nucleotidase n=1 Tax=Heyndrickxia ginsengihumi TaxID=363870 RepID=UPI003D1E9B3E